MPNRPISSLDCFTVLVHVPRLCPQISQRGPGAMVEISRAKGWIVQLQLDYSGLHHIRQDLGSEPQLLHCYTMVGQGREGAVLQGPCRVWSSLADMQVLGMHGLHLILGAELQERIAIPEGYDNVSHTCAIPFSRSRSSLRSQRLRWKGGCRAPLL